MGVVVDEAAAEEEEAEEARLLEAPDVVLARDEEALVEAALLLADEPAEVDEAPAAPVELDPLLALVPTQEVLVPAAMEGDCPE